MKTHIDVEDYRITVDGDIFSISKNEAYSDEPIEYYIGRLWQILKDIEDQEALKEDEHFKYLEREKVK